ncbi:hypothetical protein J2Z83_000496 [Virgibacillus natechei]|uniref:Uncharacterized protein n=1 Tax=Virgibacillus natechei TaxID=1216297 RepID=A0ABS4IBU0_9BACI|nr:hypothetical protein [Virgibacillus natechei]MBP1968404.1 hypothetical protein [Virgibacillus natechei]UZD13529.1 hypothetical protein OLD84_02930 [Virgibacillus natechei]
MNNEFHMFVENIIESWPEQQREGAEKIMNKYGLPQEAITSRLIWYDNYPWQIKKYKILSYCISATKVVP